MIRVTDLNYKNFNIDESSNNIYILKDTGPGLSDKKDLTFSTK
jgi:hypothetical protein